MLLANGISKHFGKQTLFENISFSLTRGEKVGLVGRNGSGKSTLFRMILGEMEPDDGEITMPRGYKVGTLPQHIHFTKPTILEEGCLALGHDEQYDSYKVERLLCGLGFSTGDLQENPAKFSGGFQTRINLAKALIQNPDLLLLDEPTNYMDIVSQRWLKQYLRNYRGEIILITHDRQFMDGITTHTMGLHRQKLKKIQGDTTKYYLKLQEEEKNYERTRKNQEQAKKHLQKYIDRFRASARRASQAQSRIKKLAKFENMDPLAKDRNLELFFNYSPCPGKTLMSVDDLSFSYDPANPLINRLSFSIGKSDRLGIIGRNGKGKSTLLNLLAGELTPVEGSLTTHPSARIGHFGQMNIVRLNDQATVADEIASVNPELKTEHVRAICGQMMFDQDLALKKIGLLSGGERSRVVLGKILANTMNLLLLDEPTNHLDQESVEGLVEGLEDFEGAVVIVTHGEMILNRAVNKLVVFHRGRVEFIDGNYEYFLNKFGWEDEDFVGAAGEGEKNKELVVNKKEIRKKKSQIITERSKVIKPLKKEMDELECEICRLEEEIKRSNEEIVTASQKKDVQKFVVLSRKIKENQKKIDKNFLRLEKVSTKHDEEEKNFETELNLSAKN